MHTGSKEWHLIVLPKGSRIGGGGAEEEEEDVMIFLKFYDPTSQSLEYIGTLMVRHRETRGGLGGGDMRSGRGGMDDGQRGGA